jgi:hypothetical protein
VLYGQIIYSQNLGTDVVDITDKIQIQYIDGIKPLYDGYDKGFQVLFNYKRLYFPYLSYFNFQGHDHP